MTNIAAFLERQSNANHPPIAPMPAHDQLAPLTPPPLPQPKEGMVKEMQLTFFMKLKPLVPTGEDVSEDPDPQWFFNGSEKAYLALGCSNVRRMELATYELCGKAHEW